MWSLLEERVYGPDEFIIRASQSHRTFNERCIYFMKNGQATVRLPNGKEVQQLTVSSHVPFLG